MNPQEDRFWSKVDRTGECWVWMAAKTAAGYGVIWWDGRLELAHRVAHRLLIGPIPDGHDVDHLCRNRACIRHLEAVTHATNVSRGEGGIVQRGRSHCPHGHEYTEENTYLYRGKWRHCRACHQRRNRIYKARVRGHA